MTQDPEPESTAPEGGADALEQMRKKLQELEEQTRAMERQYRELQTRAGRFDAGPTGYGAEPEATWQWGTPSPVGGSEPDLVELLQTNPQQAIAAIGSKLLPLLTSTLSGALEARLRNERTLQQFLSEPDKPWRRSDRYAAMLEEEVTRQLATTPSMPIRAALERAEPAVLDRMRAELSALSGLLETGQPQQGVGPPVAQETAPPATRGTAPRAPRGPAAPGGAPTVPAAAPGVGAAGTPRGARGQTGPPPPPSDEALVEAYVKEMEGLRAGSSSE